MIWGLRINQFLFSAALAIAALDLFSLSASAQSLTIQGKVLDGSNVPVAGSATQFRVQVLTPDSNRCVLYDESRVVDLSATNGLFSINLNDGSGTVSAPSTYTLDQALSNRAAFTVASTYCASGSGSLTYTPGATDIRKVVIQFRDPGTMSAFETIPEMDLNPVAWAMESRTVGGYPATALLRVVAGGTPGTAPALSAAEMAELQNLVSGTSTKYVARDAATGAALPSFSGNPSSPVAGNIWFDSSGSGAIKFKDTSGTIQTLGAGGGGGTITSITASGALTGGGSSGAVTVSLPTTGVTGFGSPVGSATSVPVITYDSYGRLTTVTTAPISGTLPSGTNGEFLKYSAGAWGSAAVRMSDIKNATGAAALFGSTTCSASETFYWDSGTDQFKCQSIALGAPSSTVAATYTKVTVAADGRVNGGSATIGNSDIADLAWSKLTGVPNLVANGGSATSIVVNSSGSKPSGQTAGRIYVDIANQKISYDDGTAWVDVSGSASATPSVSVSAPLTSTSGTVGITQATTSTNGYLSSADWNTFSGKLSSTLNSALIWVGNASNVAAPVAPSGNVSLDNAGKFTVMGIRDQAISGAGTNVGQVLRYSATNTWAPEFLTMKDLRSTVTGTQALTSSCTAGKTLYWDSGTDSLGCQDISIAASTQITGQLPIANGGTGTNSAGQNLVFAGPSSGAGAPAFRSLAASDLPSEAKLWTESLGNINRATGNVGIGTATPSWKLDLYDGLANATYLSINNGTTGGRQYLIGSTGTGNGQGAGKLVFYDNTSTSTRMVIDSSGNIGIGTTNPGRILHVSHPTSATFLLQNTGVASGSQTATIYTDGSNGNLNFGRFNDAGSALTRTDITILAENGNVGLGTGAPTVSLDLATRTDAIRLPAGSNAQQPGQSGQATAANGMIRYNTSSNALEAYVNGAWTNLATVGGTQSFAGNVSVGGTFTATGAATFNGGATIAGGALAMGNQNITGVGSNITGSAGLTIASGGGNTNLALNSSGAGAVNVGSGNGTSLSVLDGGASTVNYVTIKGAAAGAAPVIGTAGSDANIHLALAPKGGAYVGIGTTVPTNPLHVVANAPNAIKISGASTNSIGIGLQNTDTGGNSWNIYDAGSASDIAAGGLGIWDGNAGKTRFAISNAGNVGIGTTDPKTALMVTRDAASAVSSVAFGDYQQNGQFFISGATDARKRLAMGVDTVASPMVGVIQAIESSVATRGLALNPSGGNVGIGTAAPAYRLDLNNNTTTIPMRIVSSGADTSVIRFENNSSSGGRIYHVGSTDSASGAGNGFSIYDVTGSSPRFIINPSGFIGIGGVSNPAVALHVGGNIRKDYSSSSGGNSYWSIINNDGAGNWSEYINSAGTPTPTSIAEGAGFRRTYTNAAAASPNIMYHQYASPVAAGAAQAWKSYLSVDAGRNSINLMENGGNVGIGSTLPTSKLEINDGGTSSLAWGASSPTSVLRSDQGGSVELGGTNGSINATGAAPYIDFHYGNGLAQDYNVRVQNSANNQLRISTVSGGDVFTVNGGAVGIGTTSPFRVFHIATAGSTEQVMESTAIAASTVGRMWRTRVDPSTAYFNIDSGNSDYSSGNVILQLRPNGNGTFTGTLTQTSDERLKRDIAPVTNALERLLRLQAVNYYWKDKQKDQTRQIGLIAQAVEKEFPEAVLTDGSGWKSVAYGNLVAPVINAIGELFHTQEVITKRVNKLEAENAAKDRALASLAAKNAAVEKENAEIKARLEKIEEALLRSGQAPAAR